MTEDDDIDGLAAEYVLGSLDPAERRQVDARRNTDASLAAAIAAWERRLGPLSDRGRDVAPPAHVFDGILSRISGEAAQSAGTADVVPLLRAVNAAYNPDTIHTPPPGEYRELNTGRRHRWAEDRVM